MHYDYIHLPLPPLKLLSLPRKPFLFQMSCPPKLMDFLLFFLDLVSLADITHMSVDRGGLFARAWETH